MNKVLEKHKALTASFSEAEKGGGVGFAGLVLVLELRRSPDLMLSLSAGETG